MATATWCLATATWCFLDHSHLVFQVRLLWLRCHLAQYTGQESSTLLKLGVTSWVTINAKGCQFDIHF